MIYTALGIMTGTSCDGVNIAIIETDGKNNINHLFFHEEPFHPSLSRLLIEAGKKATIEKKVDLNSKANQELSNLYTSFICDIIQEKCDLSSVDVVGFHGQTILHQPHLSKSFQLGNPSNMAKRLQKKTVFDFRNNDMKYGGQGAPLAPLYHVACVSHLEQPVTFVNIGGVSNVTYCQKPYLGFDIGPGNAISDDLCQKFFNTPYDKDGYIAQQGNVNHDYIKILMQQPVFLKKPPKSFDRNEFDVGSLYELNPYDAVATANYLCALLIIQADNFYKSPPKIRVISGGGTRNKTLMSNLRHLSDVKVVSASEVGLNPDAIEAECFAWLAVRSICNMPLSEPSITGASKPVSGGILFTN